MVGCKDTWHILLRIGGSKCLVLGLPGGFKGNISYSNARGVQLYEGRGQSWEEGEATRSTDVFAGGMKRAAMREREMSSWAA